MEKFYVTLLLIIILMGIAVLLIMMWGDSNDITGFAGESVVADLQESAPEGTYYICQTSRKTVYYSKEPKESCIPS